MRVTEEIDKISFFGGLAGVLGVVSRRHKGGTQTMKSLLREPFRRAIELYKVAIHAPERAVELLKRAIKPFNPALELVRAHVRVAASNLWLCIFPAIAMLTGNIFLIFVAQGQEVIAALSDIHFAIQSGSKLHGVLLVFAFAIWVLATWYMSQVALSKFTTFFPRNKVDADAFAWQQRRFPLFLTYLTIFPALYVVAAVSSPVRSGEALYPLAGLLFVAHLVQFGPLRVEFPRFSLRYLWPFALPYLVGDSAPPITAYVSGLKVPLSHAVFLTLTGVFLILLLVLRARRGAKLIVTGAYALIHGFLAYVFFHGLIWLLAAMSILAGILWLLVQRVSRSATPIATWPIIWVAGVGLVLSASLTLAFALAPARIGWLLGTPATLLLSVSVWSIVMSVFLVFIPRAIGLPSLAGLLVVAFVLSSFTNDNHSIIAHEPNVVLVRETPAKHFKEWLKARTDRPNEYPVFLISAAGGGIRAAYWTNLMLATMDDVTCGEFGRHVYAISGVSGGSLGAAAYVSMIADRGPNDPSSEWCRRMKGRPGPDSPLVTKTHKFLSRDFLTPTLGNMLLPDAVQRFTFYGTTRRDRGYAMENSWEVAWEDSTGGEHSSTRGRFALPFMHMYQWGADRSLPSLLLNSTRVEDGRRVVTTNLDWFPTDSVDFLAPEMATNSIHLSTAVHNSARFIYLSPAGAYYSTQSAPSGIVSYNYEGRLVDGGYFENTGLATLAELYDEIVSGAGFPAANVFVIAITNQSAATGICPITRRASPGRRGSVPPLSEALAPIETIIQAREGRTSLSLQAMARRLKCGEHFIEWGPFENLSTMPFGSRNPPLGWYLSAQSIHAFTIPAQIHALLFPLRYLACDGSLGLHDGNFDAVAIREIRARKLDALKSQLPLQQSSKQICG